MLTRRRRLEMVKEDLGDCRRCGLCKTRTNIVFGDGDPDSPIMFIDEAPGQDEDAQGLPFVGKAGQLLDKIIKAMGWSRETVYIANILKCRPPENRYPDSQEIATCLPFLERQIGVMSPRVIITMGNLATKTLFGIEDGIMSIRGKWREYSGIKAMPTFHPAFLLRQPSGKRPVWRDMRAVVAYLTSIGINSPFRVYGI